MAESQHNRRVAWVTTDLVALDDPDRDVDSVVRAAALRGVTIQPVHWQDSSPVDWSSFALAVIRSPWDYPDHVDEFLTWLDGVATQVPVENHPETIRWNLDKSYLLELARAGVPVVSTTVSDTTFEVAAALAQLASDGEKRIVIKPNVSAGSRDTGLFDVADPAAMDLAAKILGRGRRVLIQPEIPSVATQGETGLIFVDGEFCHAIHKGPILAVGGELLGGRYTENVGRVDPTDAEIELAEHVIAACPDPTPLYARIDIVATERGPQLLEAELFEPSLFCDVAPDTAARLARAIAARVGGSVPCVALE